MNRQEPILKKRPAVVRVVGGVLALLLLWHGFATVAWLSGSATLQGIVGYDRLSAYINPMFRQNWTVFAPDPTHENTAFEVRARTADGTTEWFDIIGADVQRSILHHPIPSRLYLTNFQLVSHYQVAVGALPDDMESVPTESFTGADWPAGLQAAFPQDTTAADQALIHQYIKNETAVTSLAAAVARARFGNHIEAVQVRIITTPVPPFPERDNPDYRVTPTTFQTGWRPPVRVPGLDEAAIRNIYGGTAHDNS